MADGNVRFPFGPADVQAFTGTGAKAVTVDDLLTVVNLTAMTGEVTVNLTFETGLPIGARMLIHAVQGATGRDVVLGTGFAASAADLTGVANDEDIIELYYNGTSMINLAAWQKIVDAA
jgi:hypothetical protein